MLFSHIEQAVFWNGWTMNGRLQRPIVVAWILFSWVLFLRLVGVRGEYNFDFGFVSRLFLRHILCQHTDSVFFLLGKQWFSHSGLEQVLSHHDDLLRSRRSIAGHHGRLREDAVCFHFFPRSVGFGPTSSWARGAFTIAPSMLCHLHAIPSISSYSWSPALHNCIKNPAEIHSWKYRCTALGVPNLSLESAFHWQPVLSTYMMPSKTLRDGILFLPPPIFRLYFLSRCRLYAGINGSTFCQKVSETSHDAIAILKRG